jgi:hypothetical protein
VFAHLVQAVKHERGQLFIARQLRVARPPQQSSTPACTTKENTNHKLQITKQLYIDNHNQQNANYKNRALKHTITKTPLSFNKSSSHQHNALQQHLQSTK